MLDIQDATRTIVRFLEASITGIGITPTGGTESDLGKQILSATYVKSKNPKEDTGRVMPSPPDPKWIVAHVPSLAFWSIGQSPKSDYHIKKKYVTKNAAASTVETKEEFYNAKILLQVESYWRTNMERQLMNAQLATLINTLARGTGRLDTIKGSVIYLRILESREPQEDEFTKQQIYRLIQTWELRVRELVSIVEPMVSSITLVTRYKDQPVK